MRFPVCPIVCTTFLDVIRISFSTDSPVMLKVSSASFSVKGSQFFTIGFAVDFLGTSDIIGITRSPQSLILIAFVTT